MADRELTQAIQMKHLANVAGVAAAIPEGDNDARIIGYVIGKANGLSYRNGVDDKGPSIALKGIFEATPTDQTRAIIRGPAIFLPHAYALMAAEQLRGDQKAPAKSPPKGQHIDLEGVAEITMALEIGIRKTKGGGVGYEYVVRERMPDAKGAQDALADMRQYLPKELPSAAAIGMIEGPKAASRKKPGKQK